MYEYNINDYFKLDEEEEKLNHDTSNKNIKNEGINAIIKNDKNDENINLFVKELYYNLISLKNN